MFEAEDIRRLLDVAGNPLRAMILLGVNCGFGNADCGKLPLAAVGLKAGWVRYPRPKTGIDRRCPLWPETVEALHAAPARRPTPKDPEYEGLFFVTKYGDSWHKNDGVDGPVIKETAKLLGLLGLKRRGLNFYGLRHTFETVGGAAKDQVAVDFMMGHAQEDMATVYRERIDDVRLRVVADHVRAWLFSKRSEARTVNESESGGRPPARVASSPGRGDRSGRPGSRGRTRGSAEDVAVRQSFLEAGNTRGGDVGAL
jgi:integrase